MSDLPKWNIWKDYNWSWVDNIKGGKRRSNSCIPPLPLDTEVAYNLIFNNDIYYGIVKNLPWDSSCNALYVEHYRLIKPDEKS